MEANPLADLDGKVALVTGARTGIGKAIAERLAADGAQVFTAQRGKAEGFASFEVDLSDPLVPAQVIADLTASTGQLHILVNNAGLMREARADVHSLEDWNATLALNLTAPFLLIQAALPYLSKVGGSIINIGSIEGLAANPGHAAYCASKAGLHGLTRAVAVDAGPLGVRCNSVAPGWIDTDLNAAFVAAQGEGFTDGLTKIHPVGRTGKPEEVAAMVAWLASEDAGFVTGQEFVVDGGRTSKLPLP